MKPLRDYQTRAVDALTKSAEEGVRRMILRAPTGAGKTRIAREIVDRCVANDSTIVFVAPRNEIIEQTSADLDSADIDHGIIQADHWRKRPYLKAQVASIATLVRRKLAPPDVLFLDEAHLHLDGAKRLVARFPDSIVIGLTATPARLDGRGLGEIYETIIPVAETRELIDLKYLVPYRVFRPSTPELAGVRTTAGDYNKKDLSGIMDTARVVGDVVEHWKQFAEGRSTLVYTVSVEASMKLAEAFRRAGVSAMHVDAESTPPYRAAAVQGLRDGTLRVVCNVELFTYGVDVPRVSCISMARPTKSLPLYLQMTGRGLRPFPGKQDLVVIDHAGNTYRHDFPDAIHTWTLNGVTHKNGDRPPSLRTCTSCYAVCPSSMTACPQCGVPFPIIPREVQQVRGSLVEAVRKDWRVLSISGRERALAKWLRTKSQAQAIAIYHAVFREAPTEAVWAAARRANEPL